ncbi:hypothetical protein PR048_005738 [Dryococelus australis]|uniref:Uncharacterized protein n=1 Tax=Dryococelus australis TaxID=614101 RepID=A0ABQ9IA95_9NEOP|nr:hypothetical protein PR048_005738 [Dryococelus australis]
MGVYCHRRYASKQLVEVLSSLGFSSNMAEVYRYEQSVLYQKNSGGHSPAQFTQFCFDNADFNINTLDSNNVFHCMGGIRCTTHSSAINVSFNPRISETPKSSDITAVRRFNIFKYKNPISSGLKDNEINQLSLVPVNSVARALVIHLLWISGRWAGISAPPSWNGYMKVSMSNPSTDFHSTEVTVLPFINLEPGYMPTIYSVPLFSSKECVHEDSRAVLLLSIAFVCQSHRDFNV